MISIQPAGVRSGAIVMSCALPARKTPVKAIRLSGGPLLDGGCAAPDVPRVHARGEHESGFDTPRRPKSALGRLMRVAPLIPAEYVQGREVFHRARRRGRKQPSNLAERESGS